MQSKAEKKKEKKITFATELLSFHLSRRHRSKIVDFVCALIRLTAENLISSNIKRFTHGWVVIVVVVVVVSVTNRYWINLLNCWQSIFFLFTEENGISQYNRYLSYLLVELQTKVDNFYGTFDVTISIYIVSIETKVDKLRIVIWWKRKVEKKNEASWREAQEIIMLRVKNSQ